MDRDLFAGAQTRWLCRQILGAALDCLEVIAMLENAGAQSVSIGSLSNFLIK